MSLKPLPIGTDLFRKLHENNAYYVDKNSIIYDLFDETADLAGQTNGGNGNRPLFAAHQFSDIRMFFTGTKMSV